MQLQKCFAAMSMTGNSTSRKFVQDVLRSDMFLLNFSQAAAVFWLFCHAGQGAAELQNKSQISDSRFQIPEATAEI